MKKIIYISETNKDSSVLKSNKGTKNTGNIYECSGYEAVNVIQKEKPNLVLFDFTEPVNRNTDLMDMLRGLDSDFRLRVSIFKFDVGLEKIVAHVKRLFHFKPHFFRRSGRLV